MSKLRTQLSNITRNKQFTGTIVDVVNTLASVKLAGGSILKGISYVGPKPFVGQSVLVDFTTGKPVIQVSELSSNTPSVSASTSNAYQAPNISGEEISITGSGSDARSIWGIPIAPTLPTNGYAYLYDNATLSWIPAPVTPEEISRNDLVHNIDGAVCVSQTIAAFIATRSYTIGKVYVYGQTLGTSSSTIVDVHKNGTTIFTTQANRPALAYNDANHVAVSASPDVITLSEEDILTIDIDQAAVEASGLTVVISIIVSSGVSTIISTIFTMEGELIAVTNPFRIYNLSGFTRTISKIFLSINTAPTGQSIIVDVHKNGTTIFTSQSNRPVIAAGANSGQTTAIDIPSWGSGDYLQIATDQVGSSVIGSDMVVHIMWS